ncbi:MAG: hypothetical protein DRG78_14835 [Epsilonproteobacteria bacterium]|nr:MAG: hypothetical protein DRG78_14835 [Campylobacterota bacterium]
MIKNQAENNDNIDLKEVFKTILKYKVSIVLISLLFLVLSSIFAYYKPNVYASSTSIEVLGGGNKNVGSADFMLKAFGADGTNLDDEIAILKSKYIIQEALESLNLETRYYEKNVLHKKTELFKNSPFIITGKTIDNLMYYKNIELIPINEKSFTLIIKPISVYSLKGLLAKLGIKALEARDKITYNEVHKYGQEISTAWFSFTVDKINNLKSPSYSFSFIPTNDLYDNFADKLSVSSASKLGSVIQLSFEDQVSLRAKEILNAISRVYIAEGIKQKTEVAQLTLGFIDSQLSKINTQLSSSELSLQNYKVKHKVVDLTSKIAQVTEKIAKYEAEQQKLQTEINILENLQYFINQNSDLSGLTVGTINFADKSLATLVTNLQEMTDKKDLLLVDYTELHPEVLKLTKSISSTKRSIKKALSNSLRQLKQRDSDITEIVQKYNRSLNSLPSQEKELAELSRPMKVNETVYQYLLQKRAETAILQSSTIADARVIDIARDRPLPIKPKRKLMIIVGFILGLIVGISLAFLRESLIYTVENAEEVKKLTSIPIYGSIPEKRDKITKRIYAEAFKNIRTNLQFLPGSEHNNIISITSSVSGEGKTTITANLAEALARGGKNIIVLDLDMRKPSLHKKFNVENNIGMSNYLTMQYSLREVTKETDIYGLDIIPSGSLPPNPSELILSNMFTKLLDTLKKQYDYILIDTPPAGLVTDATIIMNYADISFAVIRAQYTRKEFVTNIDNMAKDYPQNRMGIILNATRLGREYGHGYSANYAYGYGNSQYYEERG